MVRVVSGSPVAIIISIEVTSVILLWIDVQIDHMPLGSMVIIYIFPFTHPCYLFRYLIQPHSCHVTYDVILYLVFFNVVTLHRVYLFQGIFIPHPALQTLHLCQHIVVFVLKL